MTMKTSPTNEQIMMYILDHRNEDFPMDQTLEDFYEKVLEYAKTLDENKQFNSEML